MSENKKAAVHGRFFEVASSWFPINQTLLVWADARVLWLGHILTATGGCLKSDASTWFCVDKSTVAFGMKAS